MHDSTLRRRAAKQGLTLSKVDWRSRWYSQYGPYMLVENGVVVAYGMDADEVAAQLD